MVVKVGSYTPRYTFITQKVFKEIYSESFQGQKLLINPLHEHPTANAKRRRRNDLKFSITLVIANNL